MWIGWLLRRGTLIVFVLLNAQHQTHCHDPTITNAFVTTTTNFNGSRSNRYFLSRIDRFSCPLNDQNTGSCYHRLNPYRRQRRRWWSNSCRGCNVSLQAKSQQDYLPTTAPTTTTTTTTTISWTREQLTDYALQQGVEISFSMLGPGYRALARAKTNHTLILGYVEGFVRPGNQIQRLLHLDKMEVFQKSLHQARAIAPLPNNETATGSSFRGGGTSLGVGLLLGYMCLLHGQEKGCTVAEFLAIDDSDRQHKVLVRYYKNAGFAFVKYVGDELQDIPDRLVWGGRGTLLRQEIPFLLQKWTGIMERSMTNKEK